MQDGPAKRQNLPGVTLFAFIKQIGGPGHQGSYRRQVLLDKQSWKLEFNYKS